ncbi:Y-family DNA polymerase [Methylobacterium dankookense]|uniref:Y-family DNA polymerase n=1 Tax=Methylobacterium dankookense TaxID=560405 RepID=UPI001643BEA2|nr:DNA polymerase Y family protein [Methylobacterium dankookense]
MARIVSICLTDWPVVRLRRAGRLPEDGVPVALAAAGPGGLRLTAVDAGARALGLRPGEPLGRVRARVGSPLRILPAEPAADAAALERLCLWAQRYTPRVAPFGPGEDAFGLHLDVTGACHLHGGEAGLLDDLERRLAAGGIPARLALADTPGAAYALARFGAAARSHVPPGGTAAALAELPVAALRCDAATVIALKRLGLKRIGALARAPRAPLARRFGAALMMRLDQALGLRPEPLAPIPETARYGAARSFLDPVSRQETIVAVARALMGQIAPRLAAHGLGALALRLSLHRVDGAVKALDLGLASPGRCPDRVAGLLRLRLDRLGAALDAGFGFESIRLDVTAADRMPEAQGMLGAGPAEDGIADGTAALAEALGQRLGRPLLRLGGVASHLPERADRILPWRPGTGPAWSPAPLPPRPVLLLARSEPAEEVLALAPEGPPRRFRWRARLHRVAHAEGPERIAAEWWRADGPARDYYAVECEAGRRLWLYRSGPHAAERPAAWFVHGVFA